ncbi:uncharacterized protein [Arachis hypogaea]|uniref:uncharacterized protein n=1 Tax=Arachis hypogaea TaxID=3818 RepID=UPI003B20FBEA
MAWAVELSQYDLQYEPRQAIKAQAIVDFLVEVIGEAPDIPNTQWKLHVDGASNQAFEGAEIILENLTGIAYEQSIKFNFPVSNNQVEYEALIGWLILAKEVRASRIEVNSDSYIVTSQINGSYQARDALLQKYLEKVKELCKNFDEVTIQHVPRERNARADLLSKLASTKPGTGNRSLIQGLATEPAIILCATQACGSPSWMDPILRYIEKGETPPDEKEAQAVRSEAPKYVIIQGQLYKRGLHQPLLKCLRPDQTDYDLSKVHEGCCGHHIGGMSLFLSGLGIKKKFSSIEHPQSNRQVEAANKVILKGLKKRLEGKKGSWADELASILWSYRTSPQSSTGETPFRLTYRVDAVIPVEIGEPSPRLLLREGSEAVEKDLVDETRQMAHLTETAIKQRIALRYNGKVIKRNLGEGDLVLRRINIGPPTLGEGKLATNWKGPYRVKDVLGKGVYKLEKLYGKEVPRTWNMANLRRFYS